MYLIAVPSKDVVEETPEAGKNQRLRQQQDPDKERKGRTEKLTQEDEDLTADTSKEPNACLVTTKRNGKG